ncbi:MAG: GGDEF domain-containing protein [Pseudomonadota bacterium]
MLMLYFTPIIMGTFSAAFVMAWYRARTSKAALFYAAGYAISGAAFTSELILQAPVVGPSMAYATDLAFIASGCLISYGICVQFGRDDRYQPFILIMVVHAALQFLTLFSYQEPATRVTVDVGTTAFILMATALLLNGVREPGAMVCRVVLKGTSIFYFLFAIASQTVLRETLNAGPLWESEHFHAIIFGTAVAGVGLGCTLLITLILAQLKSALREAMTDPLTGLCNRRGLEKTIANLAASGSLASPHALIILDLDRFKRVNDTYGHSAGDEVLVEVSQRIRALLRENDSIFRLGGEEFCVVLPTFNTAMARLMSDQFRVAISDTPLAVTNQDGERIEIKCTASFGIAEFTGPADLSRAMGIADQGLYCAKQMGRNRVCAYEECLPDSDLDDCSVSNVYEFQARA